MFIFVAPIEKLCVSFNANTERKEVARAVVAERNDTVRRLIEEKNDTIRLLIEDRIRAARAVFVDGSDDARGDDAAWALCGIASDATTLIVSVISVLGSNPNPTCVKTGSTRDGKSVSPPV
jgi:hypothetical protein